MATSMMAVIPPAFADDAIGVLRSAKDRISWSGEFANAATPAPEACGVLWCDVVRVDVRLPEEEWNRPGGVLFSIDTKDFDAGYDLDLFVYGPDGELGASADGFLYPDSAALADRPANGIYVVKVVPKSVVGWLSYRGSVQLFHAPPVDPVRDLLPNLVALKPRHPSLRSGAAGAARVTFDRGMRGPASCYADEMAEQGARRCLRFDQRVANFGAGPLELRYAGEDDGKMRQRIYRSDGSFGDRVAGSIEFHIPHGHFHYEGFAQAFLYEAREDGSRGELVKTGRKQGFCMNDVDNMRFGRNRSSASSYTDFCGPRGDDQGPYTVAGLSPGWADDYPWYLTEQYIEVTGVPDGLYVLELRINLTNDIIESAADDNSAAIKIRLRGDQVEEVG